MNDNSNSINMSLRQEALQNPQTPMLKAFLRFCHNCHQRAAYEQLLRRQQGLNDNAPVSIPLPGVPHNVIPQQDSAMDDFCTDEYMDTSNMDSQGDDWSDSSLVMDQEEQRQREDQRRRSGRS
jgi:hypothetical protein